MNKLLKSKKGMALANTIIVMFLILMMCTLIMSLTVYGTNVAAFASKTFEHEMDLDVIGYDFLRLSTNLLKEYTETQMLDEDGNPMVDEFGTPVYKYSYEKDEMGNPKTDTIVSFNRTIKVAKKGTEFTITVTNRADTVLLTVVYKQTAEGNQVTCWVYGERTQGISQ
ncbi:MAG: hypothetical protein GX802_05000 [Clostridiales bacterium]|jgi:hypothetical protein|nr:hypothetical protein [Clostridiales bacterium]